MKAFPQAKLMSLCATPPKHINKLYVQDVTNFGLKLAT